NSGRGNRGQREQPEIRATNLESNLLPLDAVKGVPEERDAEQNAKRATPTKAHRVTPRARDPADRKVRPSFRRSPNHRAESPRAARSRARWRHAPGRARRQSARAVVRRC